MISRNIFVGSELQHACMHDARQSSTVPMTLSPADAGASAAQWSVTSVASQLAAMILSSSSVFFMLIRQSGSAAHIDFSNSFMDLVLWADNGL